MPLRWRIYYADGSTWSSAQSEWLEVPVRVGIVGVVRADVVQGRQIEHDHFYHAPEGEPWGADLHGALDHLLGAGAVGPSTSPDRIPLRMFFEHGVYLGRTVSNADWQRLHAAMDADPDFPRRSGRNPRER